MFIVFVIINRQHEMPELKAKSIEKIEVLKPLPTAEDNVFATYSDKVHISQLVNFFNSLSLIVSEPFMDCQRMYENFKIYYYDGSCDTISYGFTNITYNGVFFRIINDDSGDKTRELDRLIYGIMR